MSKLSNHFAARTPSAIRLAQIEFEKRTDQVKAINTAIGNVTLPMHPSMQQRMFALNADTSPFKDGVNPYTTTKGIPEANAAFLRVIEASGFDTTDLYSQITDGGSQGMELVVLGVAGQVDDTDAPLLLIDAAYTNYQAMAQRLGRKTISVQRRLQDDGTFTLPQIEEIRQVVETHRPAGMVVIPYDNPTGYFYGREMLIELAKLAVEYDLWLISDEAYRELYYVDAPVSSVWSLTEELVPGISGRRISLETASKVWNACGLRIGALVTDNQDFHTAAIAENTASLCSNHIGQYIFAALAEEKIENLQLWFDKQREYYSQMMQQVTDGLRAKSDKLIVSNPDASIYTVVDVRNIVDETFSSLDFVMYCARQGAVAVDGQDYTLLVSPMAGFYSPDFKAADNPGRTQMRIAFVERPENMKKVPDLFWQLFTEYLKK